MGYAKVFNQILDSSIWEEDDATRILWITILVKKDRDNIVRATDSALARAARITEEKCGLALAKFQAPDPKTLSAAFEGRRIERIDGGYKVLNGDKYRKMLGIDERREYWRQRKEESRARIKQLNSEETLREVVNDRVAAQQQVEKEEAGS